MLRIIQKILYRNGLQLRKFNVENFRDENFSPIESLYRTKAKRILLSIPLDKCRTQLWNSLEEDRNPFVKTLIDYANGELFNYKGSAMETYYKEYQPQNAAEVLRLPNNFILKNTDALGFILPWDINDSLQAKLIRKRVAIKENKVNGKDMDLSFGYTEFGPITFEKGIVEFERIINVYNSIKRNGFIEDILHQDGGIRGYFLSDGEDYCFIVTSGKHRSYALSALGYKKIPIMIDLIFKCIYYSSGKYYWPNVQNSVFTENDVDDLFQKLIFLS